MSPNMMRMNTLDMYGTCSTVVLSYIYARSLDSFVRDFKHTLDEIDKADCTKDGPHVEVYFNNWNSDKKERVHCLRGYGLEDLAVVMATLVMEDNYEWDDDDESGFERMDRTMKEFGFKSEEKLYYNYKNKTSVRLYYMGASEVVNRLAQFDDEGKLIEKKEKAA